MDNLKLVSNDNGLLNESLFSYKPKQKVIITKGPFRKILGEVISLVGDKRIKILLNCVNDYKNNFGKERYSSKLKILLIIIVSLFLVDCGSYGKIKL